MIHGLNMTTISFGGDTWLTWKRSSLVLGALNFCSTKKGLCIFLGSAKHHEHGFERTGSFPGECFHKVGPWKQSPGLISKVLPLLQGGA